MERKNVSIRTYKRKSQIWFGTEADSFSYDFVWHLPLQMYLDGDILSFKREGNIPIFLNHQIVNEEKISIKNGDQIQIEDCDSANGTFLNGEQLMPHVRTTCNPGDLISFADITYDIC